MYILKIAQRFSLVVLTALVFITTSARPGIPAQIEKIFVAQEDFSPNGVVFSLSETRSLIPIISNLEGPNGLLCINNSLFVIELFNGNNSNIWKYTLDGRSRKNVFSISWKTLQPISLIMNNEGTLFFGSRSPNYGEYPAGIWKIPNVLSEDLFQSAEQILSGNKFQIPNPEAVGAILPRLFLLNGKFKDDLLIIELPILYARNDIQSTGGRVWRATKTSGFNELIEFIPRQLNKATNRYADFSSLIALRNNMLLVSDNTNGRILKYSQEGIYIGEFAKVKRPYNMAQDRDGNIYVTSNYGQLESPIYIFDENGKEIGRIGGYKNLVPITVCQD